MPQSALIFVFVKDNFCMYRLDAGYQFLNRLGYFAKQLLYSEVSKFIEQNICIID